MTTEAFAAEIRHHWKKWLPRKWKELVDSGRMMAETMAVAQMAHQEKMRLMRAGYQEHEADEVVRAEFILLKPEPKLVAPRARPATTRAANARQDPAQEKGPERASDAPF
jgi:hypothetical protein